MLCFALQAEFKYLQRAIAAGTALPQLHDLTLHQDSLLCWRFKLKGFDKDMQGALSKHKLQCFGDVWVYEH